MPVSIPPGSLDKRAVGAAFGLAAARYDDHATLQREIAERLDARLDYMKLQPHRILDVGAGTGFGVRLLGKRYRRAAVVALDLSGTMLAAARRHKPVMTRRWHYVCGDAERMPFASSSFDLVFSNLMLQWCNDTDAVFQHFRNALTPGGLCLFSTFGPDTLKELRACWRAIDGFPHINTFIDMHDLGDALIRAGLSSPVLDVEHVTLTYTDVRALMRDLKKIGSRNTVEGRKRSLMGRASWAALCDAYETHRRDGRLPATYEVVYGHAWAPHQDTRPQDGSTVTAYPLARLKGSRRESSGNAGDR